MCALEHAAGTLQELGPTFQYDRGNPGRPQLARKRQTGGATTDDDYGIRHGLSFRHRA
ncbi:hypothetical protein EES42_39670 [Streptomyces sp. ADI95-17]|nr:hypothetical protein EES42_39670 [Streptomyces sp. ADI95-17]